MVMVKYSTSVFDMDLKFSRKLDFQENTIRAH